MGDDLIGGVPVQLCLGAVIRQFDMAIILPYTVIYYKLLDPV